MGPILYYYWGLLTFITLKRGVLSCKSVSQTNIKATFFIKPHFAYNPSCQRIISLGRRSLASLHPWFSLSTNLFILESLRLISHNLKSVSLRKHYFLYCWLLIFEMYFNSKQFVEWAFIYFNLVSLNLVNKPGFTLGDPEADSGGEGKSQGLLRAIFSTRLGSFRLSLVPTIHPRMAWFKYSEYWKRVKLYTNIAQLRQISFLLNSTLRRKIQNSLPDSSFGTFCSPVGCVLLINLSLPLMFFLTQAATGILESGNLSAPSLGKCLVFFISSTEDELLSLLLLNCVILTGIFDFCCTGGSWSLLFPLFARPAGHEAIVMFTAIFRLRETKIF